LTTRCAGTSPKVWDAFMAQHTILADRAVPKAFAIAP
jgi:hypothetical protein